MRHREVQPGDGPSEERDGEGATDPEHPVVLGPSDTLDLHPFRPADVPSVVEEFLRQAREEGFSRVRIIHGKGIGVQRERVRQLLGRDPGVLSFGDAPDASGWGATIAILRGMAERHTPATREEVDR